MSDVIRDDGWEQHNIWQNCDSVMELYKKRVCDEVEEMTCAAQAAELLAPNVNSGDTLLDIGCGTGWFYHSLKKRSIPLEYYGIDATNKFIEIGRNELVKYGVNKNRLKTMRIEDLGGEADHVLCMNVLSNIDNYHRALERLLNISKKTLVLRESIKDGSEYLYVTDKHLNSNVNLKVHVNSYDRRELINFIRHYGFDVEEVKDIRTQGNPELVIDYPHYWTFLIARRSNS